ncbi:MAG: GAF domain-containing protein [Nitrospira sp.]|nr:GAF domain-containing protein [Nitrospira sp.]
MNTTTLQPEPNRGTRPAARFFSLRTKFVVFFSLILIATCTSLSWYFIESRRTAMTNRIEELGTILLTHTLQNDHFRMAGIVLEDHATLDQFVHSLMTIDHVVYVVITSGDGRLLHRQTKRTRRAAIDSPQTAGQPIYPSDRMSESLVQAPLTTPLITTLVLSPEETLVRHEHADDWVLPCLLRKETLYDFAMPMLREPTPASSRPPLSIDQEETIGAAARTITPVVGLVRIGITDAWAKQALLVTVRDVSILTLGIILAGVCGAHLLASRITTPLRSLAAAAQDLAAGAEHPVVPALRTHDEVGQLTEVFNRMTQSLSERNHAITMNLKTIQKQIRQLTTVHQASTAIASAAPFDMNHLLDTVLRLIVENLGFSRMMLVLYHPQLNCAAIARTVGVPPEITKAVQRLTVPVADDGGITADLLLHGQPVLIQDIETVAPRFYPPLLELVRRCRIQSFVGVPLQSHGKILGYLAGDRDSHACTEDDLQTLLTIAGHVAAAIDTTTAYSDLTQLTQSLEERIAQRTEELSRANRQLQEHDRRRSTFLSVVSHELRTPMTSIRNFTENMLDGVTGPLTDMQRTYLTRIEHNVARLGRIIVQLLDWSRLDTKKVPLRLEDVDIAQLATITAASLHPVASEKQISLALDPIESLPTIQGDRDKLEQILWNLIGNAIKFTPPGGRVTVEFAVLPSGDVQTCVADTGCGIDPVDLANVFQEFSGIPSAMPSSQGAQLGLCITKTLVTLHHGRIWAESHPGVGSRFYFTLPIRGAAR